MTITAQRITLEPGSPEWLETVSASQISTILGVNPWQSAHTLWHLKKGTRPKDAETDVQNRGHQFEPLIAGWFTDAHPEWIVAETGAWRHVDRTWQTAAPDRLLIPDDGELLPEQEPTALLEIKTAHDLNTWGDTPPDHYLAQCMWQMDCIGVHRTILAVCGPFELFDRRPREYVIDYQPGYADALRTTALAFLDTLDLDIEPDPDYRREDDRLTARWKHTAIIDDSLDVPDEVAVPWLWALGEAKRIDGDKSAAAAELAAFVGDAKTVVWRGTTIGSRRKGRSGQPPTFSAAKGIADKAIDLLNSMEATA